MIFEAERNYTIRRGELWERLIIPKDRRTRRKRTPTEAAATVLINDVKYVLPSRITSEGGVLMQLSPENTEWFADGVYLWDMVIMVSRSALLTSTPMEEVVGVKGTLTVSSYDNLTPMDSDGNPTPLVEL